MHTHSDRDFTYEWTPPSEGIYDIKAHFEGNNDYEWSTSETTMQVTAPPEPTETPEEPAYNTVDLIIIAAVVIAIIIGIINFWALKKQQ